MKKTAYLLAAFAFLCLQAAAQTGLTTITASHISVGGKPIVAGKVLLTPVDANGKPIAFVSGAGGGLNAPNAFACTIAGGALAGSSCQIPDACLATPDHILYTIDITATASYVTFRLPMVANICGPTWALDTYAPPSVTTNAQPLQITYDTSPGPNPCATGFHYQLPSGPLTVCVGGVPVPVGGGSVTAAAMAAALEGQTGCATAGNAWNPATNTCLSVSGGSTSNPGTCTVNTVLDKCLGVSPYLAVAGDWSTAINQAVGDLASTGGTVHGCGYFPFNNSPIDPSSSNALLRFPIIPSVAFATNITIRLKCDSQNTTPNIGALSAMTLITSVDTAGVNFLGGQETGPAFTAVKLVLDHVNVVSTHAVPQINMLNANWINAVELDDVIISGTGCAIPVSGTGGTGLITPSISNNFQVTLNNVTLSCLANNALIHEHAQLHNLWIGAGHNCLQFDAQSVTGNSIGADHIWMQNCVNYILGGSNPTSISLSRVDFESDPGAGFNIDDPSNFLTGFVNYKKSSPAGVATANGGTNLSRVNLADSSQAINSAAQTIIAMSSTNSSGGGFTVGGTAAGTDTWGFYPLSSAVSSGHVFGLLAATAGNWAHLYSLSAPTGPGFDESPDFFVNCWSSSHDVISHGCDTGLSRDVAGTVDVGDGTQGNKSGTLKVAHLFAGSSEVPTIPGSPTGGQAVCLLAAGPPPTIGKCTSAVGAGGACTCVSF